ncbi:FAD-dependent oxidoreductase [Candidatus Woesearchaeota archaeon]|nr:FAD-dependent oxidoreductase [Candidatus Woesearchaeota archaeon]
MYDTIIVGAGVAGLGAAMYSGRFGLKTLLIGETMGGTIILTDTVENYPGFKKLTGMELADKLKEHALEYDVEVKEQKVVDIEKKEDGFVVKTAKEEFETKTVIYATGTKVKKLGAKGEEEFSNKGVHYCALCDGPVYQDKVIGIIGGSDSAAKEALLLTQYGKKVYIIYRKEKIRPEPINAERVDKNDKIEIINNTNVVEIKGDKFVESVVLDKEYKGSKELKLDAVFIEIGHIVLTDLAKKLGVELNKKNEIIIDREAKTNLSGFFAAGDCVDTVFKQAITGVGEAVSAAYSAYQYVK